MILTSISSALVYNFNWKKKTPKLGWPMLSLEKKREDQPKSITTGVRRRVGDGGNIQ